MIVLFARDSQVSSGVTAVTDSKGNTYTQRSSQANGTGSTIQVFTAPVTTQLVNGDTITGNLASGATGGKVIVALAYGGMSLTSPYVTGSGASFTGTTAATSGTTGSTVADRLVIGAFAISSSATISTPGSGYTNETGAASTGTVKTLDFESKIVTGGGTGTEAATATLSASATGAGATAVFRAGITYTDFVSGDIPLDGRARDADSGWTKIVRELPPLRLHVDAITLAGRHHRWGSDEPKPEDIFSGLRFSSTMPGGFESMDCVLPRKPGVNYSDLERLADLRVLGAGGDLAGEYRLERTPQTSGDQMAISPSAVGWQAHLEDNKDAREIYVDRDLSKWQGPGVSRRLAVLGSGTLSCSAGEVVPDAVSGLPSLLLRQTGPWTAFTRPEVESWYDGGGVPLASVYYAWRIAGLSPGDGNWFWGVVDSSDGVNNLTAGTGNLRAAGPGSGTFNAHETARQIWLALQYAVGPAGGDNSNYDVYWTVLAVYGQHGLPKRGTADFTNAQGFYASDVVGHAVGKYAPMLVINADSIQPSSFVIPQLAFLESTTSGEIVRQATRFGLQDWAVWGGREFVWHDRGIRGRKWRARIAPAQLEETGQQVDRLWESIVVQYSDVDGTTKTVGPPGSGASTESSYLKDDDPENPANKAGIIRRDRLVMGVGTAGSAIEVGRRFLAEQKTLDRSGRARLVGYVEDDHGVIHPYWRVRAGDQITFVDAADTSYRRIVRADHDNSARAVSVDLDAPPEGLQAVLERLGVVLSPLGL